MECNRAEAQRSLEIAEKLLIYRDLSGSKKFAIKAQKMFPQLEGIDQVLAIADVLLASEKKINGLMNWYAILQIKSDSDDLEMKKQYRKLSLLLHPDKNKCVGADTAFKLVVEAWAILSDSSKKSLYDTTAKLVSRPQKRQKQTQNRKSKGKAHTHQPKSQNFDETTVRNPEQRETEAGNGFFAANFAPPHVSNSSSFWTVCPFCFHLYEYLRVYENHNLKCQKCHKAFYAAALSSMPPIIPGMEAYYFTWGCFPLNYSSPNPGSGFGGFSPMPNFDGIQNNQNVGAFPWGPFFPFPSPQPVRVHNPVDQQEAQANEQKTSSSVPEKNVNLPANAQTGKKVKSGGGRNSRKRKAEDEYGDVNFVCESSRNDVDAGVSDLRKGFKDQSMLNLINSYSKTGSNYNTNVKDEVSLLKNAANLLVEKAKKEILKNLSETKRTEDGGSVAATVEESFPAKMKLEEIEEQEKPRDKKNGTGKWNKQPSKRIQIKSPKKVPKKESIKKKKKKPTSSVNSKSIGSPIKVKDPAKSVKEETRNMTESKETVSSNGLEDPLENSLSIIVPDSDFYNFDQDRRVTCFKEGEIWSIYDEEDGMPRIYAQISKLVSLDPFVVQLSWLVPCDKQRCSCGRFRFGTVTTSNVLNLFSHRMSWKTSAMGSDITIHPKKSEVWAVHGRLASSINSNVANITEAKYQIVEILCDFNPQKGIIVIPLLKVDGFKSVYRKPELDSAKPTLQSTVTKKRMHKFSHQIPARRVGEESPDLGVDSWELDPAAIPSSLLDLSDRKEEERKLA